MVAVEPVIGKVVSSLKERDRLSLYGEKSKKCLGF